MRAGGVPEVIEDGVTGLLADSRAKLADRVAALARDPALRIRMAGAARKGLERFAWESVAEAYERVYEDVRSAAAAQVRGGAIE
jgi:glycosyltransferase involved in cell wall biosynthesis